MTSFIFFLINNSMDKSESHLLLQPVPRKDAKVNQPIYSMISLNKNEFNSGTSLQPSASFANCYKTGSTPQILGSCFFDGEYRYSKVLDGEGGKKNKSNIVELKWVINNHHIVTADNESGKNLHSA